MDIFEPLIQVANDIETYAIVAAAGFKNFIAGKDYDLALIRADRFELLLLAGICAYRGIPIAHIEGGADSGADVIDTRVRNAITQLADIHLVTDEKARRRVQMLGADNVYNVGSLDVSFASIIAQEQRKSPVSEQPYILFLHHALPGEDTDLALDAIGGLGYEIVGVKANSDYKASLMSEEWSPEDFIALMQGAVCMVGNSSAMCKELSVLGTPGVLVGTRQDGRVIGRNVMRVPHDKDEIRRAVEWQIAHGRYARDDVYYKKGTEKEIVKILKRHL